VRVNRGTEATRPSDLNGVERFGLGVGCAGKVKRRLALGLRMDLAACGSVRSPGMPGNRRRV